MYSLYENRCCTPTADGHVVRAQASSPRSPNGIVLYSTLVWRLLALKSEREMCTVLVSGAHIHEFTIGVQNGVKITSWPLFTNTGDTRLFAGLINERAHWATNWQRNESSSELTRCKDEFHRYIFSLLEGAWFSSSARVYAYFSNSARALVHWNKRHMIEQLGALCISHHAYSK